MGVFQVFVQNIVDDELIHSHDLIVNPTNPRMVCGSGVSGAIFHKAGTEQLECYTREKYQISYFTEENLMKVGEVRITPGFDLGIDIMFVQGPRVYDYEYEKAKALLLKTYQNMLEEAYLRGYHKILLPSLGTGSYGFEHKDVAKDVVALIKNVIKDKDLDVDLILYAAIDKVYYEI